MYCRMSSSIPGFYSLEPVATHLPFTGVIIKDVSGHFQVPPGIKLPLEKVKVKAAQSCPTLCDPVDCSLPGSSVHDILQARILE